MNCAAHVRIKRGNKTAFCKSINKRPAQPPSLPADNLLFREESNYRLYVSLKTLDWILIQPPRGDGGSAESGDSLSAIAKSAKKIASSEAEDKFRQILIRCRSASTAERCLSSPPSVLINHEIKLLHETLEGDEWRLPTRMIERIHPRCGVTFHSPLAARRSRSKRPDNKLNNAIISKLPPGVASARSVRASASGRRCFNYLFARIIMIEKALGRLLIPSQFFSPAGFATRRRLEPAHLPTSPIIYSYKCSPAAAHTHNSGKCKARPKCATATYASQPARVDSINVFTGSHRGAKGKTGRRPHRERSPIRRGREA